MVEADDAARSFFPFGGVFWLSVGACRCRTTASGDCRVGLLDGARPLVAWARADPAWMMAAKERGRAGCAQLDVPGWLSPPQMAKANRGSSGCELARPVVRLMRTIPHHFAAPRRFICFGIAAPDGAKCPGWPVCLPFVMRCAACRYEREKARGSMEPRGEFSN